MNRWVQVGVLGVGCVVLAALLFRRPDTGGELPPPGAAALPVPPPPGAPIPDPGAAAPLAEGPAEAPSDPSAEPAQRPTVRPLGGEVSPALAAQRAWRGRPAAVYSTRALAPLSTIRFTLMKQGGEARRLADELGTGVMADLRGVRASRVEDPLTPLLPAVEAAAARVEASAWGDDPAVREALESLDVQLEEFREVIADAPPTESPWAREGAPDDGAP